MPNNQSQQLEKIRSLLEEENNDLKTLDLAIEKSFEEDNFLSININHKFDQQLSFAAKLSDQIADFVGSWRFIIVFALTGAIWIFINAASGSSNFDPYPFILLNLILSCVAAMQAPLILMSQNRQEEKDRLRAEQDYKINLQSELEVRQLHMKVDQLLKKQWHRLLEIQRVQTEMLDQMLDTQKK